MKTLVAVEGQTLRWYGKIPEIADNSVQFVQLEFSLPEDWVDLVVVAQFSQTKTYNKLLENGCCYLPAELVAGPCEVSLFGQRAGDTVRATSVPLRFKISRSGFTSTAETPVPPTPDLYAQLLEKLGHQGPSESVSVEDDGEGNVSFVPGFGGDGEDHELNSLNTGKTVYTSFSDKVAREGLKGKLDNPGGLTPGKLLRVKSVDQDGNILLEGADMPSEGSSVVIDTTLTQPGQAADAKATGDAISKLSQQNVELDTTLTVAGKAADAEATGARLQEVSAAASAEIQNTVIEKVVTENTSATLLFNFWAGKKGGCLGDSISAGYYTDKTFYNVAKELLNMADFINYGISGTCIGGNRADAMSKRFTEMSDDLDVIVVAGGVNDMGLNVTLGNINSTDETTFYGALKVLCAGLVAKYPTKQIIFITPSHIGKPINFYGEPNAQGYTLKDYADAIIRVCGMYSIPVLDGYRTSGIYPENTVNRNVYTHDGLHWNTAGHYRVGLKLAQFMLFGCIPNQVETSGGEPGGNTHTHSYTASVTTPATCTTAGVRTYSCSCGESYTEQIPATGHNYVNGICTVCGAQEPSGGVTTYAISNALTNVTSNNSTANIDEGERYTATLTAADGYELDSVTVMMGGEDVTETVYANGVITIAAVTGDVIITASASVAAVSFVGKTMTLTGFRNTGFHLSPMVAVDDDAVAGNVVKAVLVMSNCNNMKTSGGFGVTFFDDDSLEVSNNKYGSAVSAATYPVGTTDENGNPVLTVEKELNATTTKKYLRVTMGVQFASGSPPGSFKIEDLKVYVNGNEKTVLNLGGIWTEETFTLA